MLTLLVLGSKEGDLDYHQSVHGRPQFMPLQCIRMGGDGLGWMGMVRDGCEWSGIGGDGLEWVGMVRDRDGWSGIGRDGPG